MALIGNQLTALRHLTTSLRSVSGYQRSISSQTRDILDRVEQRESNARTYVRKFPMVVAGGEGAMLWDIDGKEYYDCIAGAGTLTLGHNPPVVKQALIKFLETSEVPLSMLDFATVPKDEFVTSLFSTLPKELRDGRVHFCSPAGTDCIDAAVKLCKIATGRKSVLCFHGSYHGHGQAPLAMMGNLDTKSAIPGSLMPDVHFLPFPYKYRNPFGIMGDEGANACMKYIETLLSDAESGVTAPACVVVEVVQGEGGANCFQDEALRTLRALTTKHGIPLVIDEIQAGFCRTGRMHSFERAGIVPDVACFSKAVGGQQPLAVICFKEELNQWQPGSHTGTFRGNTLSFVAGVASFDFMKENRLWEAARQQGWRLRQNLKETQSRVKSIGDVRGRGVMIGVEFVDPRGHTDSSTPPPEFGDLAADVQKECFKRGLIIERGGRQGCVLRFLPPAVITDAQVDASCQIFSDAVSFVEEQHGL